MKTIKDFFGIKELVCPHVFDKFGEGAWALFDPRLLAVLLFIRTNLWKAVIVNNWHKGGQFSQRGYRCNLCQLVKEKTIKDKLYCTAHSEGMAIDFDVVGMTAEEVRTWLHNNRERLPYSIRLETNVNWVHLDVRTTSSNKITYFVE